MFSGRFLLAIMLAVLFSHNVIAQDWGPFQEIGWGDPPETEVGEFNPSYCVEDSCLYFDGFLRLGLWQSNIWVSRFAGYYQGQRFWMDPVYMPYPVNTPNQPEIINAMPGISVSGDSLFFCSDRTGTYGGLDIWMSVKEGMSWSEPINLGDSVNSELDELSPHYASGINTLFFDRLEQRIGYHFGLYKSSFLGDGNWQEAQRLPEIINPVDYGGYDPSYDNITNTLYYSFSSDIYRSFYVDGSWSEPEMLGANVNGGAPDPYSAVSTGGAWISSDSQLLFFNKGILLIDFSSFLCYSEIMTGMDDRQIIPQNQSLDISIFPNPSNCSFKFVIATAGEGYNLAIFNMLGQLVKEYDGNSGHAIIWDGTDNHNKAVSSGIYFVKVISDCNTICRKLLLQK
jgi:hypothetical protein